MGERHHMANTVGAKDSDMVVILISEYKQLLKDAEIWRRLEAGGVNGGWDWYGESLNPKGEETYDEFCEKVDQMFKGDQES